MELNNLLHAAVDSGASDLLLASGAPPVLRIDGRIQYTDLESLTPNALEEIVAQHLSDDHKQRLARRHDVDFALTIPRLGRFRFNVHRQRGTYAAAVRFIPNNIPQIEQLGLPPIVESFTRLEHGLVLVTGQTGSGKSTTLAAMVQAINRREAKHIITLEDPIEFAFIHAKSLIEQREIGADCPTFASALRHVLRQSPDVILIGEMRDQETIATALRAAETGHLVLATMHTSAAAGTVDRIIDVFPTAQRPQVQTQLAECLKGVVTQRLLPRAAGRGRVPAAEIMVVTHAVRRCIRESENHLIDGIIATGRKFGMQTMQQAIQALAAAGNIDPAWLQDAPHGHAAPDRFPGAPDPDPLSLPAKN